MRKSQIIAFSCFVLFLISSTTRAQTISSQKGLTTAVFPTQFGNVKVYMPDDIGPKELISGTVVAEPKGNNAKQTEKNLAELVKFSVSIDGNKFPVTPEPTPFKWLVQLDRQLSCPVELLDASGVKAHELTIPLRKEEDFPARIIYNAVYDVFHFDGATFCIIPSHALVGEPARIAGNFDGDLSNTQCLLNNQPTQILAESPRQCIVRYPENGEGKKTMEVKENEQEKCKRQISGVEMQVTTGKLNLRKGEKTHIDIRISGLQDLPDKATLTITNVTPNVVTMPNGNLQVIPIWPPDDSAGGTFSVHCPAVSITTGNFSVNINLDLPQPWQTPTPITELPPGYTRKSCNCGVTATVTKTASGFSAVASPACTGVYGIGINTFCACSVVSTTYLWKIQSGQENVELVGKTNGSNINIKPKNNGGYTVCITVTTTCIDGTICTATTCVNQSGETVVPKRPPTEPEIPKVPTTDSIPTTDTIPNDKYPLVCSPDVKENVEPKMVGGLKNKQTGPSNTKIIFRDEFIALEAEGSDVDQVTFFCNPVKPCPDSKSEKTIAVTGKVRFEWKISAGEGKFVKLGCGSEDEKNDKGEHITFQPPYVALPVKNADTSLTTTIELSIIDDGSPKIDATVKKIITIKTTRSKSLPDKYTVEISGGTPDKPGSATPLTDIGSCELVGPIWKPGDHLSVPEILLPAVTDADKMVLGQWIVLKTQDQSDPDPIGFECLSKNCTSSSDGKSYPDNIIWEWTKTGGGDFILGNMGQYVIYQAPMEMPKGKSVLEVKIKLKVMNPAGDRKDPDKTSKEFTLYIYQPGVKLSHPELTWLPKEDNSLELKSELMYKMGDKWMPALAHMCRIHYFELLNVSTEKGVSLNAPKPKDADDCRDLKLKNESMHEAFDDAKGVGKCDKKEMYQQARTRQPEKEYSIKIYSQDFGSYGFLRSFANVNKKTSVEGKPVYISIPWKKADVTHPNGRLKKTEYADNRVTIPHDIDENKICDGGWITQGGVKVEDPLSNNVDEENKPAGDGFDGDGLSTYEEYRGFKVMDKKAEIHIRTNHKIKDVFIQNRDELDISLYASISELDVHEISVDQYVDDKLRWINPNFNKATHVVDQRGLKLINGGNHSSLLGIAVSEGTLEPTIPNFEKEIRVYQTRVEKSCKDRDIPDCAAKLNAVVAHELLHGNNVCHHGEGDENKENSFDLINGLRSGNVSCVMRYDNVGTVIKGFNPEAVGSALCSSAAGTGYNANNKFFKDASVKRGICKGQIRISAKAGRPKSCGNR